MRHRVQQKRSPFLVLLGIEGQRAGGRGTYAYLGREHQRGSCNQRDDRVAGPDHGFVANHGRKCQATAAIG
jgi:hypothetical protein